MTARKEIVWELNKGERRDNVTLTFTRKGIEVNGWYDSMVGIGPTITIPWAEVLTNKTNVEAQR